MQSRRSRATRTRHVGGIAMRRAKLWLSVETLSSCGCKAPSIFEALAIFLMLGSLVYASRILKPLSVGGWKPPRVEVIYSGVPWMALVIYTYTSIDMSFFIVSKDREVHPSSYRPGVRAVTMCYLRRLGCRLHPMSRLLCKWNRLLCSKAFMQWHAKPQGYSRACVCLFGFMLVLVFVFGCRVCVCGRVACIGMQNSGSIRVLVWEFVRVSVCV